MFCSFVLLCFGISCLGIDLLVLFGAPSVSPCLSGSLWLSGLPVPPLQLRMFRISVEVALVPTRDATIGLIIMIGCYQ